MTPPRYSEPFYNVSRSSYGVVNILFKIQREINTTNVLAVERDRLTVRRSKDDTEDFISGKTQKIIRIVQKVWLVDTLIDFTSYFRKSR